VIAIWLFAASWLIKGEFDAGQLLHRVSRMMRLSSD